jgi:hypothetical protein
MKTVLLRHFPELEPGLDGVANAFAPWTRVRAAGEIPAPANASIGAQATLRPAAVGSRL